MNKNLTDITLIIDRSGGSAQKAYGKMSEKVTALRTAGISGQSCSVSYNTADRLDVLDQGDERLATNQGAK